MYAVSFISDTMKKGCERYKRRSRYPPLEISMKHERREEINTILSDTKCGRCFVL